MDRGRNIILGGLFALLVLTSGCLGVITGSEPLVLSADEAGVTDAALSQTDFEHQGTESAWINQTVEQAGQEREIRVQNHVATYRRPVAIDVDGVTFGAFVVASTPKVSIAGQAFNPIGQMSSQEMLERFTEGSDVRDIQRVDSRTLTVLGTDAEVTRFSGVVQRSGQEVPVYVEVTRVSDDDDFVVAIGVYPQQTEEEVRPGVTTLFEGVDH